MLTGSTFDEAEVAAIQEAENTGSTYVSAYDDPWVINGQGTIGLELAHQLAGRPISAFLAPLSGGGLIAGVSGGLKEAGLSSLIISIDAAEAEAHERNRGLPGVCDKVRAANETAREIGLHATASVTMSKLVDYDALPGFLESLAPRLNAMGEPPRPPASNGRGVAVNSSPP